MTRRLGIALIGMVIAAVVLAGLGTVILAAVDTRRASEAELRDNVESLGALFEELSDTPAAPRQRPGLRQRLDRVAGTLRVEGISLVVVAPDTDAIIGTLPDGVVVDDLDVDALRRGETVSGRNGDLSFAATGTPGPNGAVQALVLTRTPESGIGPAFRWFLLAAAIAIALAVVVTLRLSRALTRPVRLASSTASRIAAGDLSARIPESESDIGGEIGELVRSVNTMADELERSRHLERQFFLSVSHDLRTPLTSIRGYAEALTDGALTDPTEVGGVIESEARRLERLVGDLLLLARLEGTGFEFRMMECDAAEIVEDATQGFERAAAERGIELVVDCEPTSLPISTDPDRAAQIVSNLVANALRYAQGTIVVALRSDDGAVVLSVADDGPGIAEADLPHVFDRLYVSQRSPRQTESGSGLGLAIVRELAEGLGGTVRAGRAELGGAELIVSLPKGR